MPQITCTLLGRQTHWKNPADLVVTTLFGMSGCGGVWVGMVVSVDVQNAQQQSTGKCNCCSMTSIGGTVVSHSKANICGVEFTAGNDVDGGAFKRCGSMITYVFRGQSYYGRVIKFFSCACDQNKGMYAYVEWWGVPEYTFFNTPLVVKVCDNAPACPAPQVISIFDIDPSRIIFERSDRELSYYMCRIEGVDTIKS